MPNPTAPSALPGDLTELPRLLERYYDPNQRSEHLMAEISALIGQAEQAGRLPLGSSLAEVQTVLGTPYREIGEAGDAHIDWHYPVGPPAGTGRSDDPWYLVLRFRDGVLERVEHRIWREAD